MSALCRFGIVFGCLALAALVPLHADDRFVDFDTDVDFTAFRTFAIGAGAIGSRAPELDNALTRKSINDTIRARLVAKKLTEGAGAEADLTVTWSIGAEPRRGSRALRPGRPRRVPFTYTEGTLVIEMTTRHSTLVWHGTYRDDETSPGKIAEHLPRSVGRLLDDYPPRK
jgi:hypothetical protein